MPLIHLANVACGFHARLVVSSADQDINYKICLSDFTVMNETVQLAKTHGVRVGSHPSLPGSSPFSGQVIHGHSRLTQNCHRSARLWSQRNENDPARVRRLYNLPDWSSIRIFEDARYGDVAHQASRKCIRTLIFAIFSNMVYI